MSGTTNGNKPASIVAILQRADSRWAKDNAGDPADPDYLTHLATFLQPAAKNPAEPPIDEHDLAMLREQVAAAETNAGKRQAELDQARTEIGELRKQIETDQRETARTIGTLESTRRERDQLLEQLDAARAQPTPEPAVDPEKVREQAKLIRKLRADYDAAIADTQKLADQLQAVTADRDRLKKRLDHRCSWQWHGPDEPIKPCSCSRPAPRYELREVR